MWIPKFYSPRPFSVLYYLDLAVFVKVISEIAGDHFISTKIYTFSYQSALRLDCKEKRPPFCQSLIDLVAYFDCIVYLCAISAGNT